MFPLIRGWTDVQRSPKTNLRLGLVLSFVAGATNAGGFLAVGRYTSHMTGVASSARVDVKREIEQYLAQKANAMLDKAFGAGQAMVMEQVSGFCDRILPYQASDAMEVPSVGRALMDAVLGLAPNVFPEPTYNRMGTFGDTGLGDSTVNAL